LALVELHHVPEPDVATEPLTGVPLSRKQTKLMRPDVPDATLPCAVTVVIAEIVELAMG
jgi:hypothetical protein